MAATAVHIACCSLLSSTVLWSCLLLPHAPIVSGLPPSSATAGLFSAYRPASKTSSPWSVRSFFDVFTNAITHRLTCALHGQLGWWDMVQLLAACSLLQAYRVWGKRKRSKSTEEQPGAVGNKSRSRNGIEAGAGHRQQLNGRAKSSGWSSNVSRPQSHS